MISIYIPTLPQIKEFGWFFFADSPIDYQIHNITGKLMDNGKIKSKEQRLLDYSSGTYLLTLLFNETVINKQMIIR